MQPLGLEVRRLRGRAGSQSPLRGSGFSLLSQRLRRWAIVMQPSGALHSGYHFLAAWLAKRGYNVFVGTPPGFG